MISSANLQFDKMVVDTKLAQDYIKQYRAEFHPIGVELKDNSIIYDNANNKIHCSGYSNYSTSELERSLDFYITLTKLAANIQDNVDLFCQLEYLIRQKPIESTRLELNMIMKHLRHQASLPTRTEHYSALIMMKNDTPIIDLGCIASLSPAIQIMAVENTAVVCHLFTELCHKASIDAVRLSLLKDEDVAFTTYRNISTNFKKSRALEGGCIGLVTTQSDVESAVNILLSAPTRGLWGLRRILVQESTIERFKTELSWKTQSGSQAEISPELQSLCTDVYVHDDKVYLREYVGSDANLRYIVQIESFRTVKEVLTLIDNYSPFCVSLWSHGSAESNEIAFGITAPMVWVNSYGTLGDPDQVSLAYFSHITHGSNHVVSDMETVRKLQKDWTKLSHAERRSKALSGVPSILNDDQFKSNVKSLNICQSHTKNFVHVGASDVVIGVCKPRDVYAIEYKKNSEYAADIINGLLNGSGFLLNATEDRTDSFIQILSRFQEVGLPIRFTYHNFTPDTFPLVQSTRVIFTSFGTIFAN